MGSLWTTIDIVLDCARQRPICIVGGIGLARPRLLLPYHGASITDTSEPG